jgi:DEAD/DEAH box helicase domain-containing protein
MLACWDCRNLQNFVQVSTRGDARFVQQSSSGLKPLSWDQPDDRHPGMYCASCGSPIEGQIGQLGLGDSRLDFVEPKDFRAELLVDELMALRPDADWERLELPAQEPRFRDLAADIAPAVAAALDRTGRQRLYTHQANAVEAALRGSHVVQATPAGSGKSLGFVLPVLDALAREPDATALFVFPLKALANDQLAGLARFSVDDDPWLDHSSFDLRLTSDSEPIRVGRYDGSTPNHERVEIRRSARLIIATPDMLHASILRMANRVYKDKSSWSPLLQGLRFVVLDEIHSYQGVFGSAVANVLRRLRRVTNRHGADPQFLTASATIGNPVELAERLTGVSSFDLVDNDGSGRRSRVVLICNPPERDREAATTKAQATKKERDDEAGEPGEGGRIAPQTIAIDVVAKAALGSEHHLPIRTIGFCQSRNAVFQLSKRIQGSLTELKRADLADHVAPYAATFLAGDRVEEEGKLRDGTTLAIVSTSALELGIDIPDLSLAVLVGYPGQISSFRQRAGRVGRTGEGLAVLIVGDDPLQQFLARDPGALQRLLAARAEDVVVNAAVPEIARRYGLAPAQEEFGGIAFEDAAFFGAEVVDDWLRDANGPPTTEIRGVGYWHQPWDEEPYANLRSSVSGKSYTVVAGSKRDRKAIGVIDEASAPRDAFVPAIWTGPGGDLYRVVGFEQERAEIYCEGPIEAAYQTRGVSIDRVEVLGEHHPAAQRGEARVGYGVLRITRQVFSYRQQHFSGVEKSFPVERGWPPVEFVTDGLFLKPQAVWFADEQERDAVLRSVEHVLLSVAPALIACDPYDLDASSDRNGIYVYDSFGGGLRLSEVLFHRIDEMTQLCLEVVGTCPCASGCPSCIMLSRRPEGNKGLSKEGALMLLDRLHAATSDGT